MATELKALDLRGKRVLIRVDFNVPIDQAVVSDDTRIRAAVPTIQYVLQQGAKVVLASHLGRPKGGFEPEFSLKQVVSATEKALGTSVAFLGDLLDGNALKQWNDMGMGSVAMLENLRFHAEEEAGDVEFSRRLAEFADVYVNDAFGTAHRAHASTAVVAQFFKEKAAGFLMQSELDAVARVLHVGQHPFTAVVGGAKISSKIGILKNLIARADRFIIGGGMVYTFLKAKGGQIGQSLVEEGMLDTAREFLSACEEKGIVVYLPEDSLCSSRFGDDGAIKTYPSSAIPDTHMGLDAGPKACAAIEALISTSNTILWNGPLGVFEIPAFAGGTLALGTAIAKATQQGAYSLVGGGDSVAAANALGISAQLSYVSTGGGALLECMEGLELPGVAALRG
ncbi:MAG: phosphoglycerate kinase [Bacteroidetes bacterium]|nr:phosphoglycerate kinase [Bacteroidota bacterium]MDA0931440.1 phosphoglycerate kinase [Bacteroidota bacterium]